VFIEGDTTAPDILLVKVPPKTLRGVVRSSLDSNVLIGGAKVELLPSNGTGPAVASTTTTSTGSGNPVANFTLSNLKPGTYQVRVTKAGWKTPSTLPSITLDPNQTTDTYIQITLEPDHVFGKGLLLISLPDDFGGQDAASVLDQPSATFRSAYWLTDSRTYAIYPDRPAAEFKLGKGLFVRFNNRVAFTKSGQPAPNTPFAIPVKSGWNMIGSVRRVPIEWLRVKVQTADGRTRTMQEAYDAGIIQNGIFGYVDGYSQSNFLQPFAGYFVRAFQDCNLIVPVNNTVGSITPAVREKVARMPILTPAQVAKEVAAAGLGPGMVQERPEPAWRKLFRLPFLPSSSVLLNAVDHWPWQNPAG